MKKEYFSFHGRAKTICSGDLHAGPEDPGPLQNLKNRRYGFINSDN
jgi:hypothetical protein